MLYYLQVGSGYSSPEIKMSSLKKHKKLSLISNNRGVTAIEFAMIAPVLILLLTAIVEFSIVMFISSVMEGATAASSRYGKTGYIANGSTRQQQIVNSIVSRTAGLVDPAKITVTTTIYPSFNSISQEEPYIDANHNGTYDAGEDYTDVNGNNQWDSSGVAGLGNANDIVVYNVSYPWKIHTPVIASFTGDTFIISSKTVVKNEPY